MDWNRKKDTRGQSGSNFRAEPAIEYRAHAMMLIWHSRDNTERNADNVRPISEEECSDTCSRDSRLIELVTAPDRPCRGHRKSRFMRVLFKAAAQ